MKAGLYARVSTNQQETENQMIELKRYAAARGWQTAEYVDKGLSGALGEERRPELKRMMGDARRRKLDAVLVWDFSRFARSMRHLVEALDQFRSLGITFVSLREGVDTTTANGRLVFGIFASLAEFERELIRERIFAGLNRARSQGKKFGRPRLEVDAARILNLKQSGNSVREIARQTGINRMTIARTLAQNPIQKAPSLS